jgi:hypothetical protein
MPRQLILGCCVGALLAAPATAIATTSPPRAKQGSITIRLCRQPPGRHRSQAWTVGRRVRAAIRARSGGDAARVSGQPPVQDGPAAPEAESATHPRPLRPADLEPRRRRCQRLGDPRPDEHADRLQGSAAFCRARSADPLRVGALRFYLPKSGVYDDGTGLAIDAYHRLLGWGTSHNIDSRTISYLLNGWGQFKVRYPGHGRHAEGNLGRQLLALINGANIDMIVPISSGKPSTPTVLGNFHVYRRVPGFRPDGMYYSSYFTGGYAIHGFNPAPDYPASHGCMRIPMADAIPVYNWLNFGDGVDVYY